MKKSLILAIFRLFVSSSAWGQGVAYYTRITEPGGGMAPYPVFTVCTDSSDFLTQPCTGHASIYSDSGLSVPLANPSRGDVRGNITFYAAAGVYRISIGAPFSPGYTFKVNLSSGGSGTPAGSSGQVQYNNSGVFGASSLFKFNPATPNTSTALSNVGSCGLTPIGLFSVCTDNTFPTLPAMQVEIIGGQTTLNQSATLCVVPGGGTGNSGSTILTDACFGEDSTVAGNSGGGGLSFQQNGRFGGGMTWQGSGGDIPGALENGVYGTSNPNALTEFLFNPDGGIDAYLDNTNGVPDMSFNLSSLLMAKGQSITLKGSSSGSAVFGLASAAGSPNRINFPTATASVGQCLTSDGANPQQLSWAACGSGSGANTALSNLAAVAINTTLLPGSVNTVALGSGTLPFTNVFLGTVASQAASFDSSSLSANRSIKLSNAAMIIPQALSAVSHQFATALSGTTGVFTLAQPTLADVAAGAAAAGLYDFSTASAFIKLPQGAGFVATASNNIGIDTTANAEHSWINSADAINAGFASAPAGSKCAQTSGTKGLLAEITCTTPTSTEAPTNKNFNAESTGNTLSEPIRAYFAAAGCGGTGTTAGNGWDFGTTNIPSAQCVGTTVRKAVLQFAHSNIAYLNWHLPKDWNSSASTDIEIGFTTTDTTNGHTVIWDVQTGCNKVDGTATDDPSLNAQQQLTVTAGASQVAGGQLTGLLTGLTMTGCVADYNFEVQIKRDGADTNTDTAVSAKFAEIITGVSKNAANR